MLFCSITLKKSLLFLFSFIYYFPTFIKSQETYVPYSDYKNPTTNSIYGTGNRTLDILYRNKCKDLCDQDEYSDEHCCEGNTLEEMKCQSFRRCQEILDNFQLYVINIALLSYFCLLGGTIIVVFFVYYCYTKDPKYKCKNAYSSSIIVLFAGTVLPIIILQFYCWFKAISIEQFFGANFNECMNVDNLLQSVDVKNDFRPRDTIDGNSNNINKGGFGEFKEKDGNAYIVEEKGTTPKFLGTSTRRSANYMIDEKYDERQYNKEKSK